MDCEIETVKFNENCNPKNEQDCIRDKISILAVRKRERTTKKAKGHFCVRHISMENAFKDTPNWLSRISFYFQGY
jgi:hypothetical protein